MYALIASDSAALRSAASVLLSSFNLEAELLFASNISEIQAYLRLGSVRSAIIDPNIPGYGRDFDVHQLARDFPDVRVSCLAAPRAQHGEFHEAPAHRGASPAPLTARQHEVLSLLREGRSTKEIARRLDLAVPTVKTHLAALYRQLGVRNRVEAVMKAVAPAHRGATFARPDRRAFERYPLQTA